MSEDRPRPLLLLMLNTTDNDRVEGYYSAIFEGVLISISHELALTVASKLLSVTGNDNDTTCF